MNNEDKISAIRNHISAFRFEYQRLYQKLREVLAAYGREVDREKIQEISEEIRGKHNEKS